MNNIFIGMLLVFLNFNLDIGSSRIGLIPSFLGYIFMLRGVAELTPLSAYFSKVKPYVTAMAVYSGICYAMDLLGLSAMLGEGVNFVLGLFSTVLSLVISYNIVTGVKDIEMIQARNLSASRLYSAWKVLAIFSLVVYVLMLVPLLAIGGVIAGLIAGIYYLYVFHESKKLFYQQSGQ